MDGDWSKRMRFSGRRQPLRLQDRREIVAKQALLEETRRYAACAPASRGTRPDDCVTSAEMLRSPTNMTIRRNFPRMLVFVSLLYPGSALSLFAQTTPPQPTQTAPTGPGGAPVMPPSSRMTPTGLQASGGSIANDVYTNSIYGFSMKIPPGWVVVPSREPKVATQDAALLKAAQISRPLLVITENAPLKKSYQRKNIQIIAARMRGPSGPTSAQDYLAYSQKTAKEKNMDVEYLGDPQEVTVNGQTLWKLASNEPSNGVMQHVEQYVTTREAVLLQFFLVSPDEGGLKQLEPYIQSLELKPMAAKTEAKRSTKKPKAAPPAAPNSKSTDSKPQ